MFKKWDDSKVACCYHPIFLNGRLSVDICDRKWLCDHLSSSKHDPFLAAIEPFVFILLKRDFYDIWHCWQGSEFIWIGNSLDGFAFV